MLKSLKLPSALIISLFCSATLVKADEQLLDGVRPFICDGEAVVLLEADGSWAITSEPDYKVSELRDGWQIGDQGMGFIAYLKEYEQDEWILEVLSDDGYEEVSCIDLAEGVSEVVTAIKPRLDEAIVETQEALAEAKRQLTAAQAALVEANRKMEIAEMQESTPALSKKKAPQLDLFETTYFQFDKKFTTNLRNSRKFLQLGLSVSTTYDESIIEHVKIHAFHSLWDR